MSQVTWIQKWHQSLWPFLKACHQSLTANALARFPECHNRGFCQVALKRIEDVMQSPENAKVGGPFQDKAQQDA